MAQQNLYATNFRLHRVHSEIVLRNTGTDSLVATPRLRPAQGDPNSFIDLGGVSLAPQEIRTIDLDSISGGTRWRSDFDTVSIEVINTGAKGSLIAALNGIDDRTGMSYDVPLRDSGGTRNLSGAYPWRLDGDVSTIVSITNAAAAEAKFVVQINYPGGPYLLDPQKLAAGDTKTFNLREIRDRQIPDRNGHTIPKSVQGGQFRWFIHSAGHLIGRAEMLSVARGISSSYSCGNPCPPRFSYGFTSPDPVTVPAGDSTGQSVMEIDVDSYDNEYGPYGATVDSAWSWDTEIATFDGATVTGVSEGQTGTTATVEYPLYVNWEQDCSWYGTNYTNINGYVLAQGKISLGSVSFTSPDPVVIRNGDSATLRIVLNLQGVTSTSSVRLTISTTAPSGGAVSLSYTASHDEGDLVCTSTSCTRNVNITFTATSNPTETGSVKAHVKVEEIPGVTPATVTVSGEADSSNTLTVQKWPQ